MNTYRLTALGLALVGFLAQPIQAADAPKQPGPELKKLEVFVGVWTYEGLVEPSPFWSAAKYKGKSTNRMVLGGFFLESLTEDKDDHGIIYQSIVIEGYDPVTKAYVGYQFENDGTARGPMSETVSENTWTRTGTRTDSQGKVYKTRSVGTLSSDKRTITTSSEYSSDDGKTWMPLGKETMTKVNK